ncbi:TlpA disulfide reductase family protein [Pseudoxanthomonas sp. LjRoot143]|uniref:TlpA disulfide reductase family protein n=1 Tax=Pseudoxanthomonas sp. LjRoot143 TaxID=3342266 RepID=UPI003ECDDB26
MPLHEAHAQGFVVIVLFFRINCPLSLAVGLPQLERLRHRYRELPVRFLAVHSSCTREERRSARDVQAFMAAHAFSFPVCMDRPGTHWPIPKTMHNFGVAATPTLLILDQSGHERFRHTGRVSDCSVGAGTCRLIADELERVLRPSPPPSCGDMHGRATGTRRQPHCRDA